MKIVGFSIAALAAICLTGCAGTTASQPSPVGAPGAANGAANTAKGSPGKETVPKANPNPAGTRATVKNGVTVHPVTGAKATRLPGLSSATPSASAAKANASSTARTPLVRSPLPKQASAKGRLAAGHPTLLGQLTGSTVTVSSVSPAGNELQVGLSAVGAGSATDVLAAYRAKIAPLGFTELTVHAAEGASAVRFTRGHDVVTVSAKSAGKQTDYTVFGLLHTTG